MPEQDNMPVVDTNQGSVLDDAGLAPETPQEEQSESLSSILEGSAEQPQQPQEAEAAPPAKEPGWIKQRVDKAVSKAVREAEARVSAQYEAMLAPIRESVLDRQAEDLVKSGEFKTLDVAKEYVRLKNGAAPTQRAEEQSAPSQPRDTQGRFQANSAGDEDPTIRVRSDMLARQATKIKSSRGVDVMAAFNSDDTIKQRVLSGEWDFYDVADQLQRRNSMPSPMRSTNGAGFSPVSVMNMTDEQFKALQRNLEAGKRYDMRK